MNHLCGELLTMLFIHPMWDNETQRVGKQKCTPIGYKMHVLADNLGVLAFLLLVGVLAYLAYIGIAGIFNFHYSGC